MIVMPNHSDSKLVNAYSFLNTLRINKGFTPLNCYRSGVAPEKNALLETKRGRFGERIFAVGGAQKTVETPKFYGLFRPHI